MDEWKEYGSNRIKNVDWNWLKVADVEE